MRTMHKLSEYKGPGGPTPDEIRNGNTLWFAERLAAIGVPRKVVPLDSLPCNKGIVCNPDDVTVVFTLGRRRYSCDFDRWGFVVVSLSKGGEMIHDQVSGPKVVKWVRDKLKSIGAYVGR